MVIALDGSLLGARFSGVERSVGQLLAHLPEAGPDDTFLVFVGRWFEAYREQFHPDGLDARLQIVAGDLDNRDRRARLWWQQVVLPRLARDAGAEVFAAPAYVAPALGGLPCALTLYDLIAFSHPTLSTGLNRRHYRLVIPPGARQARRVVVPSTAVKYAVGEYLPEAWDRTVVVPLGVDDRFFAPPGEGDAAVRAKYRLPERYLLWVGNVEPKKNLPLLMAAVGRLKERGVEVPPLLIAGELSWGTNDLMLAWLNAGLQRHVRFLGRVRDAELPALYRGANAFLFPSLIEGFGLPVVEAMAAGVPVAVSDRGSLPEVVGDAGLVLPADDADAWAEAIPVLVGDADLRARLIPRGRSRALAFTWRRTARAMVRVYHDCAD